MADGVPKGRKAEDGTIPAHYALQETDSANYPTRTERNVVDSDGTAIISIEAALGSRGSALTQRLGEASQTVDSHSLRTARAE